MTSNTALDIDRICHVTSNTALDIDRVCHVTSNTTLDGVCHVTSNTALDIDRVCHVTSNTRPSRFSVCNTKKFGLACKAIIMLSTRLYIIILLLGNLDHSQFLGGERGVFTS